MKIWDADVVAGKEGVLPGTVLEVTKKSIIVQTGKDALSLNEIQLAGKKRMKTEAFLSLVTSWQRKWLRYFSVR